MPFFGTTVYPVHTTERPPRSEWFSTTLPSVSSHARNLCARINEGNFKAAEKIVRSRKISVDELSSLKLPVPFPYLCEDPKWDAPLPTHLLKAERYELLKAVVEAGFDLSQRYSFHDETVSIGEHALWLICIAHRNRRGLKPKEKAPLLLKHAALLLEHGVNPNHPKIDGATSLWNAVTSIYSGYVKLKNGHQRADLVFLLLEKGADPTIRHGGNTISDLASGFYGDREFGTILLTAEGRAELKRIFAD